MEHAVRFAGKQRKHCKLPRIFSKCKCFAIIHRVQKGIIAILSVCLKKVESWLLPKFQAHLFCSWKKTYLLVFYIWYSMTFLLLAGLLLHTKNELFCQEISCYLIKAKYFMIIIYTLEFSFSSCWTDDLSFFIFYPFFWRFISGWTWSFVGNFWILKLMWKLLFFKAIRSLFITAKVTPI